ncbi:hypothetical protein Taro_018921 [Colocasia esculenta]|uniref:Uncharacterized protein n=1 Tax=Colocasia esculenta TaxID=4460 RepID=A0A843UV16_COLES|nr:hypothetical protein [Colocasia esculenta]
MEGAHHSCPAPSDSTGSSSLPEKGVDTPLTGVDTMLQTQDKIMQNWSSSVDTRSSSVDTCVDTSSSSVDTRDLPRTPSGLFWDSVSTLAQVVSTLVPFQNKTYRNIVNVTVELSSFGRPKKEKLEPHLRPLHEATAPT